MSAGFFIQGVLSARGFVLRGFCPDTVNFSCKFRLDGFGEAKGGGKLLETLYTRLSPKDNLFYISHRHLLIGW